MVKLYLNCRWTLSHGFKVNWPTDHQILLMSLKSRFCFWIHSMRQLIKGNALYITLIYFLFIEWKLIIHNFPEYSSEMFVLLWKMHLAQNSQTIWIINTDYTQIWWNLSNPNDGNCFMSLGVFALGNWPVKQLESLLQMLCQHGKWKLIYSRDAQ